jgi:uncharacterized protein (TIGR02118 family)
VTVKLLVLYTQPADPAAFEEHYAQTHMPLVHQIPGLQRTEAARVVAAADGGERAYYRATGLYFADQQAFAAAMASPEGKATAEDYQRIAPPGSRLLLTEVD